MSRRGRQKFERPSITAVLEHYGAEDVPQTDWWRSMRCPFHEDRTKSGSVVTADGGAYRCFACDINGSAFDVIMWKEGLDFRGALTFYTDIAGDSNSGVRRATRGSQRLPFSPGDRRGDSRYLSPGRRGGAGTRP